MKKVYITLSVILLTALIYISWSPGQDGPLLVPEKDMIVNFGTVKYGSERVRYKRFQNKGNDSLVIWDCKSSCGCMVPKCPKGRYFLPGESGIIKVEYDTKRIGRISKTLTIKSNSTDSPIHLRVRGEVLPPDFNY